MHALSLLALAAAMSFGYRQFAAHPVELVRKLARTLLATLALVFGVAAAQSLPGDIRQALEWPLTDNEKEADRAARMIEELGGPRAYIDYLNATAKQ